MTATKTHYTTIFAKAFPGERADHQRCSVDQDGTVRVYDHCAGYYTTCHKLSETDQELLRERAKVTIRNTNERLGEPVEYTGQTLGEAVAAFQDDVTALGYGIITESDYEIQ